MGKALITDIRVVRLEVPLASGKAYGSSRGLADRRSCNLIFIETDEGVTGIGEAWGPGAAVMGYLETVKSFYLGQPVSNARQVWHRVAASLYHHGIHGPLSWLLSGVDIALHDIAGKLAGVPVHELFGGAVHEHLPVYASGGYFTRDLDRDLDAQLDALQNEQKGRSFSALKIKIGASVQSDVDRCSRVRERFPDWDLIVDANGNYTTDPALASMQALAPFNVLWYEEPLAPTDLDGYRQLHARAPFALSAGEAHYSAVEFDRLLTPRCIDIAQPDVTKCGGLSQARLIAQLCTLRHAQLSPHAWGGAIGFTAALHLLAAQPDYPHSMHLPRPRYLEFDIGHNPLRDELLLNPPTPENGMVPVPMGLGLGVELNPDTVARYRVDP